jgi:hypothetical protein
VDDRPAVSAPDALTPEALAGARRAQPRRGLLGLALVVPVAALLAAGAGGPVPSMELFGPPVTAALPVVAMIAFWWADWPGSLLRGGWPGLSDTVLVAAGGVLLCLAGTAVTGQAGPAATVPLSAGIFTLMLQLTLVGEGWPFRRSGLRREGVAALAVCWLAGVLTYLALVRSGLVPAEAYAAFFAVLGFVQTLGYVALRGWPFARIRRRTARLATAHCAVAGCAAFGYAVTRQVLDVDGVAAVAGAGIASVLVVAMLFEAWPGIRLAPLPGRTIVLALVAVLTAALSWALPRVAQWAAVPERLVTGWATHATLNALSLAVILHVAVWRRWPLRSAP